jgi:hypothetical protein
MKITVLIISTILFFSCSKKETTPTTTPTPKFDTITLEASCVGDYKASFDINYNYNYYGWYFNGISLITQPEFVQGYRSEKIVISLNDVVTNAFPKIWSKTFIGVNAGSFSISCKPPFTGTNSNSFSSYISLTVKRNGLSIGFAEATSDTSGTASINAHIP